MAIYGEQKMVKSRWKAMDNVFLVVIGLIMFFAYMDVKQITTFFILNTPEAWNLYNLYTAPAIWSLWYIVLLAIGIIWYVIYKDKSEAIALVVAGWALIWFGAQDVLYFMFSGKAMTANMCWADNIVSIRLISDLLGEACPSAVSFLLSALLGVFISYKLYNLLREKW